MSWMSCEFEWLEIFIFIFSFWIICSFVVIRSSLVWVIWAKFLLLLFKVFFFKGLRVM